MDEKISELKYEVNNVVDREYLRASEKNDGKNHSDRESYAVILEAFEDADAERRDFILELEKYWTQCKVNVSDDSKKTTLTHVTTLALHTVCAWVKVAAACYKAVITVLARDKSPKAEVGTVRERIYRDFMKKEGQ